MIQANGKNLAEIASRTGYSFGYTVKLVSKYCEGDLAAITENHCSGNHRNMCYEDEIALLEPFKKRAEVGLIVEISEIKATYLERGGHSIGTAQIYLCSSPAWMEKSNAAKQTSKESKCRGH